MRVGGGLLGELAGREGALERIVLVLDLLQLEVLPCGGNTEVTVVFHLYVALHISENDP